MTKTAVEIEPAPEVSAAETRRDELSVELEAARGSLAAARADLGRAVALRSPEASDFQRRADSLTSRIATLEDAVRAADALVAEAVAAARAEREREEAERLEGLRRAREAAARDLDAALAPVEEAFRRWKAHLEGWMPKSRLKGALANGAPELVEALGFFVGHTAREPLAAGEAADRPAAPRRVPEAEDDGEPGETE